MNCGRCRAALQGQRFCTACGAPSGSGARQGTVGGGAACQRCRQPSLDGAKFCTGCGLPAPHAPGPKCARCGAGLDRGTRFCTQCGVSAAPGGASGGSAPGVSLPAGPRHPEISRHPGTRASPLHPGTQAFSHLGGGPLTVPAGGSLPAGAPQIGPPVMMGSMMTPGWGGWGGWGGGGGWGIDGQITGWVQPAPTQPAAKGVARSNLTNVGNQRAAGGKGVGHDLAKRLAKPPPPPTAPPLPPNLAATLLARPPPEAPHQRLPSDPPPPYSAEDPNPPPRFAE